MDTKCRSCGRGMNVKDYLTLVSTVGASPAVVIAAIYKKINNSDTYKGPNVCCQIEYTSYEKE